MNERKTRTAVKEHYRRISDGLRGIPEVERALELLDTEIRAEYDRIFSYLYQNDRRSVVSASMEFNFSTSSIYRRLEKLCALVRSAGSRIRYAKIGRLSDLSGIYGNSGEKA